MSEKFCVDLIVGVHLESLKDDVKDIIGLSMPDGNQKEKLINFVEYRQFGSLIHELNSLQKKLDLESGKHYIINNGEFLDTLSNLQGRVLTSIDSAFSDETQRKAVKDLIKERFFKTRCRLNEVYISIKPETIEEAYYIGKLKCKCTGESACNYCGGKNKEKLEELNK